MRSGDLSKLAANQHQLRTRTQNSRAFSIKCAAVGLLLRGVGKRVEVTRLVPLNVTIREYIE